MRLLKRRPSPSMIVASIALVVALGGVAVASIPSPGGVITSCYNTSTGAVRIVDAARTRACATGETFLNWNQKGQKGATGATGRPGCHRRDWRQGAQGRIQEHSPRGALRHDERCGQQADHQELRVGRGGHRRRTPARSERCLGALSPVASRWAAVPHRLAGEGTGAVLGRRLADQDLGGLRETLRPRSDAFWLGAPFPVVGDLLDGPAVAVGV